MRPLAVLYSLKDPYGEWSPADYRLIRSYQQMKDELCPKCGQPVWLCHSTDPDLVWEVQTETCYATAAIEARRWKDDNPKEQPKKKDRQSWGRDYYPVATMLPDMDGNTPDLPTRDSFTS